MASAVGLDHTLLPGMETGERPDPTRFTYETLASGFDEPMQMAILPNSDIVIAERKGAVRYFDHLTKEISIIAQFNVFSGIEDGLLGVAIDPGFKSNHRIYFYYSVAGDKSVNHLARYELNGQILDWSSGQTLLEIPTQREYCCHSAGHITFSGGLLYLAIGDNTNAEEIEGHTPIDERPGRELSDDQASTANSNDYRGKILRIKPEDDGTYSIPDGNLFPKDGSKGKPEIYAMGVRNPFRISVDPKTGYLYWGDVGPNTQVQGREGMMSYDEINQARGPGFFGYPYFLGDNEVFPDYDFATKKEGPGKDPLRPYNDSPHNTGIRELPPAQPAFIWYGKGSSAKFPLVGKGGASAMAGPAYYSDLYQDAPYKLPEYYNGKLFIYDWVRKWIMAVTMDGNGDYMSMEPFLPGLEATGPIDMQIAPDGAVYLLAYGTNWFVRNTDSGIIRIEYAEGNRKPVAVMWTGETVGAAPLSAALSAKGSKDHDPGDKLTYEWKIGNLEMTGEEIDHTFTEPGIYSVVLTVSDQHGGKSTATTEFKVGNTPPDVKVITGGNRSFYRDGATLDYHVSITDREDGDIDSSRLLVQFGYQPFGKDLAGILSGQEGGLEYASAIKLYAALDCKACHSVDTRSVGPALKDISERYRDKERAADWLVGKIINGGAGNWGSYPMPPHPGLSEKDVKKIAGYILSLGKKAGHIPSAARVQLDEHIGKGTEGVYLLQAAYTDKGANGIGPLKSSDHIILRSPQVEMEDYDEGDVRVVIATQKTGFTSYIAGIRNGSYARYNNIDLTHIRNIRLRIQEHGAGGRVELRQGDRDGPPVGEVSVGAGSVSDPKSGWKEVLLPVKGRGVHDLFFVFLNEQAGGTLFHIDRMYFEDERSPQ
ncbi:MAG: PKD domain-containing protein [Cytophagaceae bacterium SCN 52-12]|nr:MAG: PKD domain-containing protein [Cytophagaceae bacterium SCN 52-12]